MKPTPSIDVYAGPEQLADERAEREEGSEERKFGGYPVSCLRKGWFQLEGAQVCEIVNDLLDALERPEGTKSGTSIEDALLEDVERMRAKIHTMAVAARAVILGWADNMTVIEDFTPLVNALREALAYVPPEGHKPNSTEEA